MLITYFPRLFESFTENLAPNLNPGMIALERLEFRHKPALFSAARALFMAPWPAKLVLTRGDFR
jgi:hypothetical protein